MINDPIPGLKEQLRQAILAAVGRMNQTVAARIVGVHEARMSNIELGRLERFSVQKLIRLLARLNRRVDLTVVIVGPLPTRGHQEFWDACQRVRAANERDSRR